MALLQRDQRSEEVDLHEDLLLLVDAGGVHQLLAGMVVPHQVEEYLYPPAETAHASLIIKPLAKIVKSLIPELKGILRQEWRQLLNI